MGMNDCLTLLPGLASRVNYMYTTHMQVYMYMSPYSSFPLDTSTCMYVCVCVCALGMHG